MFSVHRFALNAENEAAGNLQRSLGCRCLSKRLQAPFHSIRHERFDLSCPSHTEILRRPGDLCQWLGQRRVRTHLGVVEESTAGKWAGGSPLIPRPYLRPPASTEGQPPDDSFRPGEVGGGGSRFRDNTMRSGLRSRISGGLFQNGATPIDGYPGWQTDEHRASRGGWNSSRRTFHSGEVQSSQWVFVQPPT